MRIAIEHTDIHVDNETEFQNKMTDLMSTSREMWLTPDNEKNPALCILCHEIFSTMTYFPEKSHPGMNSVSANGGATADMTTEFQIQGQSIEMMNRYLVSKEIALKTALSFFNNARPPEHVEWEEL